MPEFTFESYGWNLHLPLYKTTASMRSKDDELQIFSHYSFLGPSDCSFYSLSVYGGARKNGYGPKGGLNARFDGHVASFKTAALTLNHAALKDKVLANYSINCWIDYDAEKNLSRIRRLLAG